MDKLLDIVANGLLHASWWQMILVVLAVTHVTIASVTIFLPGVSITNSARDLLSGQTLAGMAKATEAMIIAVAIAVGVGLVLQIWQISGGVL